MSLEHAILVSLAEQAATGYDLTRRFDRSLAFFWSASHQQIYRTLTRMQEAGTVSSSLEVGSGGPDRKVYDLTAAGRRELCEWTRQPTGQERPRSEFAVKVRGMAHGDRAAVVDDIRAQREQHVQQLAYFEQNASRHYPDPERIAESELPTYLVLRGGIRTEQTYIEWCDEMLQRLAAAPELPQDQENQ